jgi:DNA (cytosine-5)-methyltransferase 3A
MTRRLLSSENKYGECVMNVLSLFDGISCARVALDRAGIPVASYTACEIDKNAIKVSSKNYPDIVRAGSVVGYTPGKVDLLIGGSPCQDLSIAKKGRKGLDGDRSGLFWEYVRIWKEADPTWFILENVASMPKADRDIITKEMGVEPILINASLVSAQCRKRLFWTNLPNIEQPADRGICLKDILLPPAEVDERFVVKGKAVCLTSSYKGVVATEKGIARSVKMKNSTMVKVGYIGEAFTQTAQTGRNSTKKLGYVGENDHQAKRVYDDTGKLPALNVICNSMVKVGYIGNTDSQGNRVYSIEGKSVSLLANGGGLGAKTGLYSGRDIGRRLNAEGHRDDANKDLPLTRRIEVREDQKSGTLTSVAKDTLVVGDTIRKLTPVECERLQSLPDGYTDGVAMTQRYKCLGNAFNVEVVAHLLSFLPKTYHFNPSSVEKAVCRPSPLPSRPSLK